MSRDLFGELPVAADASGSVALAVVLHDQSDAAWLLGQTIDRREAKWVPKSKARRGEGRDENVWTMPAWMAADRGWS